MRYTSADEVLSCFPLGENSICPRSTFHPADARNTHAPSAPPNTKGSVMERKAEWEDTAGFNEYDSWNFRGRGAKYMVAGGEPTRCGERTMQYAADV